MVEEAKTDLAGSKLFPREDPPAPFSAAELRAALRHPAAGIDVLLAQRTRWTLTVVENREPGAMVLLMLVWTLAFSLPYGLVLSAPQAWKIAALFLGSVALCLPSLHVVSAYLGLRVHVAQSFAFATIIATVASMFSFGFAPILWFLKVTSGDASARTAVTDLSLLLLGFAALAGIVHGVRCLSRAKQMSGSGGLFGFVVVLWQLLLLFIGARMSDTLGLT